MDLRKVKKLIELAEEADIAELEVTSGDESVRIRMNGHGVIHEAVSTTPALQAENIVELLRRARAQEPGAAQPLAVDHDGAAHVRERDGLQPLGRLQARGGLAHGVAFSRRGSPRRLAASQARPVAELLGLAA